ncbi:MAG TPA: carbohydrate kinase family protein [Mycobacteriales bacterium]|nr:carbohydrate kinase family protein [Mycobacteriales bacterium]
MSSAEPSTAGAPLAGVPGRSPMPDPCAERDEVGARLRGGGLAADPAFDVFLTGTVFIDMIFTGLLGPPQPGTELWTGGLGSAPGGIANLAVAMSRLGLRVGLAAAFGDDMFGGYLWRTLAEQERVDLRYSRQLDRWPTPVTVSLSYASDRSLITYGERLPFPVAELLDAPPSAGTCFVHLDADPPAWAGALRSGGATVFADVGWDPSGAWAPAVLDRLAGVDVFLPNAVEAMAYTRTDDPGRALAALAARVPVAVVKNGAAGALGVDGRTGEVADEPALPVADVLDPTGAGDVFDAGFVFGSLAGWSLPQRLRFANLCAGLSVQQHSGSLGAPCWGQLAAWWEEAGQIPEFRRDYAFLLPYLPDGTVREMPRAFPTMGYGRPPAGGGSAARTVEVAE